MENEIILVFSSIDSSVTAWCVVTILLVMQCNACIDWTGREILMELDHFSNFNYEHDDFFVYAAGILRQARLFVRSKAMRVLPELRLFWDGIISLAVN